jgi:hypothetical protein
MLLENIHALIGVKRQGPRSRVPGAKRPLTMVAMILFETYMYNMSEFSTE